MKMVFYSPDFYPIVGGITNVVTELATTLTHQEHRVVLITRTLNTEEDTFPFPVLRRPGFWEARKAVRAADVIVQFNLSLKGLLLGLCSGTPLVILHNGDYPDTLAGWVKVRLSNAWAALNLAVSHYTARVFPGALVIPVPFRRDLFQTQKHFSEREKDLVFLGRLVSEKGGHLLLEALDIARLQGHRFDLTIIGNGPEKERLQAFTNDRGLSEQVIFIGQLSGEQLVNCLNDHKVMVVPSLAYEGFGLVALEGMACGCIVFAAERGGLVEAVGQYGYLFPPNNALLLAEVLIRTRHTWADLHRQTTLNAAKHLEQYAPQNAAISFVDLIRQVTQQ